MHAVHNSALGTDCCPSTGEDKTATSWRVRPLVSSIQCAAANPLPTMGELCGALAGPPEPSEYATPADFKTLSKFPATRGRTSSGSGGGSGSMRERGRIPRPHKHSYFESWVFSNSFRSHCVLWTRRFPFSSTTSESSPQDQYPWKGVPPHRSGSAAASWRARRAKLRRKGRCRVPSLLRPGLCA